jgi:hypothetical protein
MVRRYVAQRKREPGLKGREVFVPQSYEQGQEGQVDWFEGVVRLDGELRTLQFFAMRSMASGDGFRDYDAWRSNVSPSVSRFMSWSQCSVRSARGDLPR